ncbi:MAG: PEP-CTERM sorting domain-containing protein [Thermoguttaceae bacterium]|jgi:hypothetical protein|nr:PEP-CTERM sorting domain-containing protein [Thermoguttaceae bacterium]
MNRLTSFLATAAILCAIGAAPASAALIADDFNRTDGSAMGATSIGGYLWTERDAGSGGGDTAGISGGQTHLHGAGGGIATPATTSNTAQAILLAPDATDTVALPNVDIRSDFRFHLNSTTLVTTNNSGGYILRKGGANVGVTSSQVLIQMLPTGGIYVGEGNGSTINVLYANNPFVPGSQTVAQLADFQGPGSLPTTFNGLPFDVNGNGRLEADEPFELRAVLNNRQLHVFVNGRPVAAGRTSVTDGTATGTQTGSLLKNRFMGGEGRTIADPFFDNLAIEPTNTSIIFRHLEDLNPTVEGWTQAGTVAGSAGDDGLRHWRIESVSGVVGRYEFNLTEAQYNDPSGWTATAVAKANRAEHLNAELAVGDGSYWTLGMVGGSGVANAGAYTHRSSGATRLAVMDPTADYHTYQMVHDPVADVTRFYLDGVGIGTVARSQVLASSNYRVYFGDNTGGGGAADSQWNFVQYQIGQTAVTGTVLQHVGRNDPVVDEGWTLDTNNTGAGFQVSPGSDGRPSWRIEQAAGYRANYQRALGNDSNFAHPEGWTMTAVAKLNTSAEMFNNTFWADDGQNAWSMSLVDGNGSLAAGVYAAGPGLAPVRLSDVDPTEGFRLYQMIFDPAGGGLVTYYVDGRAVGALAPGEVFSLSSELYRIGFGDNNSGGGASDAQWALVRFETGQHYIPEPSSAVLAMFGVAFFGFLARRRRSRST